MKKLFLTLVAIFATSILSFADTSLAQAYKGLAGLADMSEKTSGQVTVAPGAKISNVKTTYISTKPEFVEDYRAHFIWELENLPVRNMILGANNQRELASVYAVPAGGGVYDVLIVKGNVLTGDFSASYGQTSKAGVDAIRASKVLMDAEELTVVLPDAESPADAFISMTE